MFKKIFENFDKIKDYQILIVGLFACIAVIISVAMLTCTFSNKGVTTTGTAYEVVKSDDAFWKIEVVTKNVSNAAAYKKLRADVPKVIKYLKDNEIDEKNIQVQTPSSYIVYKRDAKTGNTTNDVEYYNFSQNIEVSSKDVDKIQNLSGEILTLLEQGIEVNPMAPEYYYSDIADLKIKLLDLATQDAKKRANAMLKATRNRVSNIKSVKMGVFQITSKNSTDVSDWGINDTSAIEKKVTAVASVVFDVK